MYLVMTLLRGQGHTAPEIGNLVGYSANDAQGFVYGNDLEMTLTLKVSGQGHTPSSQQWTCYVK